MPAGPCARGGMHGHDMFGPLRRVPLTFSARIALRPPGFNMRRRFKVTRVTGFLWDRGPGRLWRQGIDLIGDNRSRQVGEGIEHGAMLGKSERREFLDVTDDSFDDVAPVEQSFVEE